MLSLSPFVPVLGDGWCAVGIDEDRNKQGMSIVAVSGGHWGQFPGRLVQRFVI